MRESAIARTIAAARKQAVSYLGAMTTICSGLPGPLGGATTDLEITMYKNLGLGNFSSRIIISDTINSNEFYSLTVNDFNNDNFKDFAVHSGHGLQLYINNTDTTFTLTDTIDTSLNGFITSIDIDNDNDIDILSVISSAQNITTFKNDGLGNFTFY